MDKHTISEKAFPTGLSFDEARQLLIKKCTEQIPQVENIKLESSLGRILAEDITAPINVPGFDNSAMDGYAICATDLPLNGEKAFQLKGQLLAGNTSRAPLGENECMQIMTGAPLPEGADTVVIKERTRHQHNQVWISSNAKRGANVRSAGEDYRTGEMVFSKGVKLTAARLGVLASLGISEIKVTRKHRVVLLTTGNEVVAPGAALDAGQLYNSNRYSLAALLQGHGVDLLYHQHLSDDPKLLRKEIQRAAADSADVLVTSGGVSAGEADFLPEIVQEIGEIYLWKVRIKPGMPFLFGKVNRTWLLALPGNPVSSMVTFLTLVRPALEVLNGAQSLETTPWRARLKTEIRKSHVRTEFQRAHLHFDENGTLWAQPFPRQGSGILRSMAETDGLIVVPEEVQLLEKSAVVSVLPFSGLQEL